MYTHTLFLSRSLSLTHTSSRYRSRSRSWCRGARTRNVELKLARELAATFYWWLARLATRQGLLDLPAQTLLLHPHRSRSRSWCRGARTRNSSGCRLSRSPLSISISPLFESQPCHKKRVDLQGLVTCCVSPASSREAYLRTSPLQAAVERTWHIYDCQGQIMALVFSQKVLKRFEWFSPRSAAAWLSMSWSIHKCI